jgi:two-component system response regulator
MANDQQFTILMVDDDQDEVFITRKLVRKSGIVNAFISERKPENLFPTLSNIYSSMDAKNKVIILLDVNMPRQDGFETLEKIRDSENFSDVPVVMLSASDNEADVAHASALGANGYMVKPFRSDLFFACLSDVPRVKHQLVLAA